MSDIKPNAELAYLILDYIDAHPEQHDQDVWIQEKECGTAGCFAGWATLLSGDRPNTNHEDDAEAETVWVAVAGVDTSQYIPARAAELLGISFDEQATWGNRLFNATNTREDLGRLVAEIFGPRPAVVTR